MDKNTLIIIAIFLIVAFGSLTINGYNKELMKTKAAQAGLEQCPCRLGSNTLIWVRDCSDYTKNMIELEKTDVK